MFYRVLKATISNICTFFATLENWYKKEGKKDWVCLFYSKKKWGKLWVLKQIFCNQISEPQEKKSGSMDFFVFEYGDKAEV